MDSIAINKQANDLAIGLDYALQKGSFGLDDHMKLRPAVDAAFELIEFSAKAFPEFLNENDAIHKANIEKIGSQAKDLSDAQKRISELEDKLSKYESEEAPSTPTAIADMVPLKPAKTKRKNG